MSGLGVLLIIIGTTTLITYQLGAQDHSVLINGIWIALTAIGVGVLGYSLLRHDVSKDGLIRDLERNGQSIVWVYYMKVETMPYGIRIMDMTTLFFMLDNGEKHTLRANEKRILKIMNSLRDALPHATFGYSTQKEQLYRANPDLLRK